MKNIKDLFEAKDFIVCDIDANRPSYIENVYEDFKKNFNILPENILSESGWILTLTHPDYDYNVNASMIIMSPIKLEKNQVCFVVRRFSKKSYLSFSFKNVEEILELENGIYPIGVGFDQLSEDQESPYLMEELLKSLDLSSLYNGTDSVTLSNPKTQKKVRIYIINFNSADAYGINVEHLED